MNSTATDPSREALLADIRRLVGTAQYAAAAPLLEQLAAQAPLDHAALYLRGETALALNDAALALNCFERALALEPQRADTLCYLGVAAQLLGDGARAETCYRRSLELAPDCTQAAFELGRLLEARREPAEAHAVWWSAGRELVARGRSLEAAAVFGEVVRLAPGDAAATGVLAAIQLDLGRPAQACALYQRVLELEPDNAAAWQGLGMLQSQSGDLPAAQRSLQRALALRPVFPAARNTLGNVYARRGDSAAARRQYELALRQDPDFADAWVNLADELAWCGEHDAALDACLQALARDPAHPLAQLRAGFEWLARGDYARGWRAHQARVEVSLGQPYLTDPRQPGQCLARPETWMHEPLDGLRLLVLPEEGVGDELFCLRFAQPLRERGARICYRPSAKLLPLLRDAGGLDSVLGPADALPEFDQALAVGDLGLLATAHGVPMDVAPFALTVSAGDVANTRDAWQRQAPGPYLGLTWRAGKSADGPRRKQIELAALARALRGWSGALVALQRDADSTELAELATASGRPVIDACQVSDDPATTARLLGALDCYAGVSNTNMHLCVSLGLRAQVLVGAGAEWRWQHAGSASPWMPGVRIHRARRAGRDWHSALAGLRAALHERVPGL